MLFAIGALLLLSLAPLVPTHFGGRSQPAPAPGVQAAPRTTFNIEQPVTLSRSPWLSLERGRFSISGAAESGSERRLVLEGATFRLETAAADAGPIGDNYGPEAFSPLMTQLAALGLDKVTVLEATLRVTGGASPIVVGPIDAAVELGAKGQIIVRGLAVHRGEALTIDAVLGGDADANQMSDQLPGPSVSWNTPARRPLAFSLKGETLGEVRLDGTISGHRGLALSGAMVARLASPAALSRWLGAPVRHASALRNLTLAGQARWADGLFDLQDARVTLDGQKPASGVLRARYRGGRQIVEGTLAFAALDISKVGATEEQAATWATLSATLTRDMQSYLEFDADLRLSATTVLLPGGGRGRGAATVTIDRGILVAELADAEWNGNKARIHVDADSQAWASSFAVRGRVELLQIQDALGALTGQAWLTGPATVTLDLKGRNEPFAVGPPLLNGKIGVSAATGARSLFDPFKIADRTLPVARPGQALLQSVPIPVETVDLRLSLVDRQVRIDQGTFKTAAGTANLTGKIERSTGVLDLLLVRSPIAGARARTSLRTPEAPTDAGDQVFTVTGAWQAPSIVRTGQPQP